MLDKLYFVFGWIAAIIGVAIPILLCCASVILMVANQRYKIAFIKGDTELDKIEVVTEKGEEIC